MLQLDKTCIKMGQNICNLCSLRYTHLKRGKNVFLTVKHCACMCVWVTPTLTYVVQVECQIFVLKQRIVGKAGALDFLEERAYIPAVQNVKQHDAGNTQTHVEHRLYSVLQCHGLRFTSDQQAELTTKTGCWKWVIWGERLEINYK